MEQQPWALPSGVAEDHVIQSAGFVYRITHVVTGRGYIGRKYTHERYKGKMRESDWRRYWGSCKPLLAEIAEQGHASYRREILTLHATRQETDYEENRLQFELGVLLATLPDGTRAYYNSAIAARWFRAPAKHSATSKAKMRATKAAMDPAVFKGNLGNPTGYRHSDETKQVIAEAATGRVKSAATREKLRDANKGKSPSAQCKEAARLANTGRSPVQKGKSLSEERKAQIAATTKAAMDRPEVRTKLADGYARRAASKRSSMKFTDDQVREIRTVAEKQAVLAERFGVSSSTITRIRQRKLYAFVADHAE